MTATNGKLPLRTAAPERTDTPIGDALAASELGQRAQAARQEIDQRLARLAALETTVTWPEQEQE